MNSIKGILILVALVALYNQYMPDISSKHAGKIMKELSLEYPARRATKEQLKEWNIKKEFSSIIPKKN